MVKYETTKNGRIQEKNCQWTYPNNGLKFGQNKGRYPESKTVKIKIKEKEN